MTRHFLQLDNLSQSEILAVIDEAIDIKQHVYHTYQQAPASGLILGMIFEKASTRTRVSFEAGMLQLGGNAIFLSNQDSQIGRGEPIEDTARVLSSMIDIIMIRTFHHENLKRFAQFSSVPVINALTDFSHPCQLLADMQTFKELRGDIRGKTVAWVGDGNNMCQSYINAARCLDFKLRIASPVGFDPDHELLEKNKDRVSIHRDAREACEGAQLISTDVWASMGQEAESNRRRKAFSRFQVNHELFSVAATDALFMHCMPAHRGEEVSAELIEDTQYSAVFQQAENRLHVQKALLLFLLRQSGAIS